MDNPTWCVGIDWASDQHAFCVIDGEGHVRGTRQVAHTATAIHDALAWVRDTCGLPAAAIALGIELRAGPLVETCLDAGFPVFAINPKQQDRFRGRFAAADAKDDPGDARVIADALRTDRRAFRQVVADAPEIVQLRDLTRLRADLETDRTRLTNRLREQLLRVDAPWLAFCPAADEAWLWTLLQAVPHPARWTTDAAGRVARVLRRHRIRRFSAADLVAALRRPRLTVAAGVPDAVAVHVGALIAQLTVIAAEQRQVERHIDQTLTQLAAADPGQPHEHRDVEILQSLPGVGRMVTATMLGEAAGLLAARDYATVRTYGGIAPVTQRSGKRCTVQMRYACNSRLRNALHHWAFSSLSVDRPARAYYDAARARGLGHARALRSLADRWLRILIAMLTARTLYDPTRRQTTPCAA